MAQANPYSAAEADVMGAINRMRDSDRPDKSQHWGLFSPEGRNRGGDVATVSTAQSGNADISFESARAAIRADHFNARDGHIDLSDMPGGSFLNIQRLAVVQDRATDPGAQG